MQSTVTGFRRYGLVAGLCVAGLLVGGLGTWWIAAYVRIIPTDAGCVYVRNDDARYDCIKQQMGSLIEREGIDTAFKRLDPVSIKHPIIRGDCHLAAHTFGEKEGRNMSAQNQPAPSRMRIRGYCSQGRYHGRLIGFRSSASLPQLTRAYVDDCSRSEIPEVHSVLQCGHAYGHSMMIRTKDHAVTLEACRTLPVVRLPHIGANERLPGVTDTWISAQSRLECTKGAMMESGIQKVSVANPRDLCATMPSAYSSGTCALSLPIMLAINGDSYDNAALICNQLTTNELRATCGYGVGAAAPKTGATCADLLGVTLRACHQARTAENNSPRTRLTVGLGDAAQIPNIQPS